MKQQLVFLREQAQQRTHSDEPLTLRLQAQQRLRLQQQLQQVYISASTHLLVTEVTLRPAQGDIEEASAGFAVTWPLLTL